MKHFINNLSTRSKLIVSFAIILVLLAVVIVTAYVSITSIAQSELELYNVYSREAIQLQLLRSHQNYNRAQILDMMLTDDRAEQEAIEQTITDKGVEITQIVDLLATLHTDPIFQSQIKDLENHITAYRQTREQEITLIYAGKVEEAWQLGLSVGAEQFEAIRALATEMGDAAIAELGIQQAADQQAARSATRIFMIVGGFALLFAIGLVVILNQTIASPLTDIANIAEQIGIGDLTIVDLPDDKRRDEVGILMQTFSRMVLSLRDMAGVAECIADGDLQGEIKPLSERDVLGNSLVRMAENLRRTTADLAQGVGLLGSSASQILTSTTQVAASTAESAASINQTTTTVEEVRQAAQLSSQKAQDVSANAQRVVEVSQSGQRAVEETSAGMDHIREQMETIAETVMRLSEQSQSIGGIIASVTDLADQSNLLAVNAAIEAAKAGEQGKGFAVVAQEIKNLAEQSKQATEQVRAILSDVQKATSNAVMATEQGSKAVEAGVKQASQAGEAIRVLAETSDEAEQAAKQIVASSQQQVVGMDQIGLAMENINQAGVQNISGIQQMETAAQNLHELGEKIKGMVAQFKV
jgi:methyl-accepting chemotaxis protein